MMDKAEKCWCGSGDTFGDCHKDRDLERSLGKGEWKYLRTVARDISMCLHPDASPANCSGIIAAHTIQRSGPLKEIIDPTNHVMSFYDSELDENSLLIPQRVGWREASTFQGFCSNHDSQFFLDLETQPFTSSPKQCFLLGYRAICHEVFQKLAEQNLKKPRRKNLDRGRSFTDQVDIQIRFLDRLFESLDKGLAEIRSFRDFYNSLWAQNNYSDLHYLSISFDGDIAIASTGVMIPDFDINGNRLQDLKDYKTPVQGLAFGILTHATGGSFVFSWPRQHAGCTNFIHSLLAVPDSELPSVLVEFLYKYVENTFFSESWWASLDAEKKDRIRELASLGMAYEFFTPFSKINFVNWQITGKTHTTF